MRGRIPGLLIALLGAAAPVLAQAGDGEADGPGIEISAVGPIEARLTDEEHGKAFGILGPVEVGRPGLFRVRAQRLVLWLDPEADRRVFDLIEGLGAARRVVPLWAVRAVYAEGGRVPAVLQTGGRTFRCRAFHFDVRAQRGVILDAEVRVPWPASDPRGPEGLLPPIVLRAERFVAHGPGHWSGEGVVAFASEYVDPEVSIELERIVLRDRGTRAVLQRIGDAAHRREGIPEEELDRLLAELEGAARSTAGKSWRFDGVRVRLFDLPLLRWPELELEGDDALGLRVEVDVGSRGQLGSGGRIGLGVRGRPVGVLGGVGWYPRRGPLFDLGLEVDAWDGAVRGRSYAVHLHDHGEDFGIAPSTRERWWTQHRYRWEIGGPWRLDSEFSDLSDARWLRTIDETEFKEGKPQETLLHLRRRGRTGYLTLTGKVRSIGFAGVVEELPVARASLPGWTLWRSSGGGRGGPVVLQVAGALEAGNFRSRAGDGDPAGDFRTRRIDADPTLFLALPAGPVRVVPFLETRGTIYEESLAGGALARLAATAGVRADLRLARRFGNVRHVVNWSVTYTDLFHLGEDADAFFPIDAVDRVSRYEELALRWRNRLLRRTARGRLREFLSLELLWLWYPDERQPLGARGDGWVEADLEWAPLDSLSIATRASVDTDRGSVATGSFEAWYRVHARLRLLGAYRHLEDDSDIVTGSLDYEIDRRWRVVFTGQADLRAGQALDQALLLQRIGKTAVYGVRLTYDPGDGDFGLGLNVDLLAAFRRAQARADRGYRGQYGWRDRPYMP